VEGRSPIIDSGRRRSRPSRSDTATPWRRLRLALLVAGGLTALPAAREAGAVELAVAALTVEDARGPVTEASPPPEVGTELYIRCRVSALGADVPSSVSLVFRVDGSIVRELSVPVSLGAQLPVGEYWTPSQPGPHEIGCEVNPDRKIEEQVYTDNAQTRTLEVRPKGSTPAPAPPAARVARATPPSASSAGATPPPTSPVSAAPAPAATPHAAAPPPSATPASPAPAHAPPPGVTAALPPSSIAKPDLAIVKVQTSGEPSCDSRDPKVTVRVTVKNLGPGAYAPTRSPALLEATVKMPNDAALVGRMPVPRLEPGGSIELEVVSRGRRPIPNAGGQRYSVVITVNGDGRVEETTLDNNGEYVKAAAFPRC